ncbi:MAG: 2-oxo-4-hydroxy-4-carboxy-5-ureidoimidazoline decarboxylase [Betaproteobacteria bacterium]|nr:MAG: 2-oxo-4-hydroxy-4-carboxy-5-ureidoimidazoline decarboxylase [Betaproteobacteria bacterium]
MTLADLNRLDQAQFVAALAGIYEHSPWVPERAWSRRPFVDINDLHAALAAVVAAAEKDEQLALIRAHPELAGKAMTDGSLTADSTAEQSRAGLMHCSPAELARLRELNARYNANFGFPFILAVKGYDRAGVIAEFARRVDNDAAEEFAENLRQIDKIARLRLDAVIDG